MKLNYIITVITAVIFNIFIFECVSFPCILDIVVHHILNICSVFDFYIGHHDTWEHFSFQIFLANDFRRHIWMVLFWAVLVFLGLGNWAGEAHGELEGRPLFFKRSAVELSCVKLVAIEALKRSRNNGGFGLCLYKIHAFTIAIFINWKNIRRYHFLFLKPCG